MLASKPNINKSIPIEKCILFAFARVQIVSVCAANLFEYEYDCEYTQGWLGTGLSHSQ